MSRTAAGTSSSSRLTWRPTKIMNMRDLSRDDDFLSHLLVEKLGTGSVPLVVHKMDASRTIPKANPDALLQIVRRLVAARGPPQTAIREAVDELLTLDAVRYYLKGYDQKQINAFATHGSRYFELYLPTGSIEIAHTSRYSHKTGKSELCILATRPLMPGMVITELKGSMADLTEEEDMELKRNGEMGTDGVQIRRDFSVIHSKQLKKNHLFLGPARFVNHDCDHNVELFREGRYITFRVIKPIAVGEEVSAHYGDGYFGRKNRHCLCETCEKLGRGGYAVHSSEDEVSDSAAGSPQQPRARRASISSASDTSVHEEVDVNERRTRRGVYAVVKGKEKEVPIELDAEVEPDVASELTSLGSRASMPGPIIADAEVGPSKCNGLMTPDPEPAPLAEWLASTASAEIPEDVSVHTPRSTPFNTVAFISASTVSTPVSTPAKFRSVISTRGQKAREGAASLEPPESVSASLGHGLGRGRSRSGRGGAGWGGRPHVDEDRQLPTPPLTSDSSAPASVRSSSRIRMQIGDKDADSSRLPTPAKDKADTSTSSSVSTSGDKGKGREDAEQQPEVRNLRPRQFHLSALDAQTKAKVPDDGPRGVDGKLLPTCMTCHNVLPVIHVEGKPVWGLALGRTGKRGRPRKNVNVECPRCMRHFEIYNLRWPERLPGDGSAAFLPTPREMRNSTPITSAALAALERKLNLATHGYALPKRPYKRKLPDAEESSRPIKKLKAIAATTGTATGTGTGRPRGRPPKKNKVGMSTKAQLILNMKASKAKDSEKSGTGDKSKEKEREKAAEEESGRRSGRTRMPSLKLRESATPNASRLPSRSRSRVARPVTPPPSIGSSSSGLTVEDSDGPAELPSTPVKKKAEDSEEESAKVPTPKSLAVAAQPRESNGRFGRKAMRKAHNFTVGGRRSRAKRVLKGSFRATIKASSVNADSDLDSEEEGITNSTLPVTLDMEVQLKVTVENHVGRKRSVQERENDEPVFKKIRTGEEEGTDADESDGREDTISFRPPLMTGTKPGVGLLRAPNPMTFARRKWASAPADESSRAADGTPSTDDETSLPVTPETSTEVPSFAVYHHETDSAEEDVEPPSIETAAPFVGKLTLKPSPINLSRRRWAPPPPRYAGASKVTNSPSPAKQPGHNLSDTGTKPEGYWSDEDEWGWPWTESEDESEEESPVITYRAPSGAPPSARQVSFKDLASVHSSPGSERSVEKLVNGSQSDSPRLPSSRPLSTRSDHPQEHKSPAINWKGSLLPGVAFPSKAVVTASPKTSVRAG